MREEERGRESVSLSEKGMGLLEGAARLPAAPWKENSVSSVAEGKVPLPHTAVGEKRAPRTWLGEKLLGSTL